jgi:hypothetical protein
MPARARRAGTSLADKAGERITYRRSGDELEFVGDFFRKGQPLRVEVRMQRIRVASP